MRHHWLAGAVSIAVIALSSSTSFAGTQFLNYEGRDAVHEGRGGEKKVVSGIDFWMSGDPPHKFQVLGSIADVRHETGIFGMIRMASLDGDIAKAAKDAGGDAVILTEESEQLLGFVGGANTSVTGSANGGFFNGNAYTSAYSRPMKNHQARYVVVKYLPDSAPVTTPVP